MAFHKIAPEDLSGNVFRLIGDGWMLVTSANPGDGLEGGVDYNTMTASWGGLGVLWGKPAATVYIRPQRHTFGFAESNERMTLSFFDGSRREALAFCGRESGRVCDKAKACGLTPEWDVDGHGRAVWFREARLVLLLRKRYAAPFVPEGFVAGDGPSVYPAGDYHTAYFCEIERVLENV